MHLQTLFVASQYIPVDSMEQESSVDEHLHLLLATSQYAPEDNEAHELPELHLQTPFAWSHVSGNVQAAKVAEHLHKLFATSQ